MLRSSVLLAASVGVDFRLEQTRARPDISVWIINESVHSTWGYLQLTNAGPGRLTNCSVRYGNANLLTSDPNALARFGSPAIAVRPYDPVDALAPDHATVRDMPNGRWRSCQRNLIG